MPPRGKKVSKKMEHFRKRLVAGWKGLAITAALLLAVTFFLCLAVNPAEKKIMVLFYQTRVSGGFADEWARSLEEQTDLLVTAQSYLEENAKNARQTITLLVSRGEADILLINRNLYEFFLQNNALAPLTLPGTLQPYALDGNLGLPVEGWRLEGLTYKYLWNEKIITTDNLLALGGENDLVLCRAKSGKQAGTGELLAYLYAHLTPVNK